MSRGREVFDEFALVFVDVDRKPVLGFDLQLAPASAQLTSLWADCVVLIVRR